MNGGHSYEVVLLPMAARYLDSLDRALRDDIYDSLMELADDPTPVDSIPMKGKGSCLRRLRIGKYRAIYRIVNERVTVLVVRIGPRETVYRGYEGL